MDAPEPWDWDRARPVLEGARRWAFDLEGDFNLHRYGRRISLFQIAVDDGTVVILDPLMDGRPSVPDWPGWKDMVESPEIPKVIWAAQNDVRALKFCHGIHLRGLWDLFDAACLSFTARPSLPLLTQTFLGVEIEKAEHLQTSDWSVRPLSVEQRAYAAQDVRYLLALADAVDPLIDEKGKRAAFRARMVAAEAYVFTEYPEPWRRLKGAAVLDDEAQARLAVLWSRREEAARTLDLAPYRLLAHEGLVAWARDGKVPEQFSVDPRWTDR